MDANGYVMIFMPQHHRANSWGVVYEHIIKAEEMLSRTLKDEEVVHHRDGNRANNNYNNLLVFHTKAEHTRFHKLNENENVLKQLDDGSYIVDLIPNNVCPICGKHKEYRAKLCLDCSRIAHRKVERPNREELKQLIKSQSFEALGRQFGVDGNTIRKWCDKYNLPRRKADIKKYSDEEWSKI